MRRRLAHGLAALLLLVSIGAGAGRNPIRSGSNRTQSAQGKRNDKSTQTNHTVARKSFHVGTASWYGEQYDGKTTASGERFDMYDLTAAHATLPLGTLVQVTNLSNGKTVIVRVNDRGPFVKGRIIGVSYNAARVLDFQRKGVQRVRLDFEECPRNNARIVGPNGSFWSHRPVGYRLKWLKIRLHCYGIKILIDPFNGALSVMAD